MQCPWARQLSQDDPENSDSLSNKMSILSDMIKVDIVDAPSVDKYRAFHRRHSLPCLQQPAISPCPKVDEPSAHPSNVLFYDPLKLHLSFYDSTLQDISFPSVILSKLCTHFSSTEVILWLGGRGGLRFWKSQHGAKHLRTKQQQITILPLSLTVENPASCQQVQRLSKLCSLLFFKVKAQRLCSTVFKSAASTSCVPHAPTHIILLNLTNLTISGDEYKSWSSSFCSSIQSCGTFCRLDPNILTTLVSSTSSVFSYP